jgi:hypothetical protein
MAWLLAPGSAAARFAAAGVCAVLLLGRAILEVADGFDLRRIGH